MYVRFLKVFGFGFCISYINSIRFADGYKENAEKNRKNSKGGNKGKISGFF